VIFLTVGTQIPFDRLVSAVDRWAGEDPGRRVFAQIGPTSVRPRHIEWCDFISPADCRKRLSDAELVVSHAGMGTILSALELGTPALVLPRRAALGEHRNDHQLATARWFEQIAGVTVAFDEAQLVERLRAADWLAGGPRIGDSAPTGFIDALRAFIDGEPQPVSPSR
jgi:UDP-N-acetylglucosamine transferase subunit ALG13